MALRAISTALAAIAFAATALFPVSAQNMLGGVKKAGEKQMIDNTVKGALPCPQQQKTGLVEGTAKSMAKSAVLSKAPAPVAALAKPKPLTPMGAASMIDPSKPTASGCAIASKVKL
jgi:hypothetical protein